MSEVSKAVQNRKIFHFCAALHTLLIMTEVSMFSKRPVLELLWIYFSIACCFRILATFVAHLKLNNFAELALILNFLSKPHQIFLFLILCDISHNYLISLLNA